MSRSAGDQGCAVTESLRAIPVDVVDSSLWFQGTGVNPEKHKRAALPVMDNLEGQSTQVVLVPLPAG